MKKFFSLILTIIICTLCFAGCTTFNTPVSTDESTAIPPENTPESICFEGKVTEYAFYDTDLLYGVPAQGAVIDIASMEHEPAFNAGTVIPEDGTFVFDGVPTGKYMLTVKKGNMLYSNPIDITPSLSPFEISLHFKNESASSIRHYHKGTNALADLDGDGETEDVYYDVDKNYKPILKINNMDFSHLLDHIDFPGKQFAVVDIDKHDNLLHLAINDYGPSSDYRSCIFEYTNKKLSPIGNIEGVFESDFTGFGEIICDGNGGIISYTRLGVFQTWHAYKRHALQDGTLIDTTGEIHYVIDAYGARLKTKAPMTLYTQADEQSQQVTIPLGTELHLTKTDDKKWIYCELADGAGEYAILLDEESYGFKVINGGTAVDAMELFEGLCYAD